MSATDVMHSQPKLTSQQLRKIKKPIIEKRRRERINESLNQLKALVLEALDKDESQYNKMEKADILEMTVKHLKHLQSRLSAKGLVTVTTPTQHQQQPKVINSYKSGFQECAEEVNHYLTSVQNVHPGIKDHLSSHLTTCARKIDVCSPQNGSSILNSSQESLCKHDLNSQQLSQQGHVSFNGVQVGVPVINGSTTTPVMISGPISPTQHGQATQGFVPVLISPNSNGVSVVSPVQHIHSGATVAGNVIPLYSSSHLQAAQQQQQQSSHQISQGQAQIEKDSSVYSSPCSSPQSMSSPPTSPALSDDSTFSKQYVSDNHYVNIKLHMRDNDFLSSTPQTDTKRHMWNGLGNDLYRHGKEVLFQPVGSPGSPVWRPW